MIKGVPLNDLSGLLACDTETTGLSPARGDRPFMIQFMDDEERFTCFYWEVDPFTREVQYDEGELDELRAFFSRESRRFVFHHGKFDVKMLRAIGIDLPGSWDDTLVAARVLRSNLPAAGLKYLGKKFCGIPDNDEESLKKAVRKKRREGKKLGWNRAKDVEADYWMAIEECLAYGEGDVKRTIYLWVLFNHLLTGEDKNLKPVYDREMKLQPVVMRMEERGVHCVGADILKGEKELREECAKVLLSLQEMTEVEDFNPNSSKQVAEYLFEKKGFPVTSTTDSGNPSTDKAALGEINSPVARAILEYKAKDKQRQFFTSWAGLVKDDQIYGSFNPCGAVTGRFTAKNPNFQQIPKRDPVAKKACRRPYRPRKGFVWIPADFSQMELMMLAGLAREKFMMNAFANKRDIHKETAVKQWGAEAVEADPGLRSRAKAVTFGISYGAGAATLGASIGGSRDEGATLLEEYFLSFPGIAEFMDDCIKEAKRNGCIYNPFGRRSEVYRDDAYMALNYKIQSSGADVMKIAMIKIDEWLMREHPRAGMILQIHDEVVVEVPKEEATVGFMRKLRDIMSEGTEEIFGIPLQVDLEYVMEERSLSTASPVIV